MDIKTDDYRVWYDPEATTVFFQGFLRLDGMEAYSPVMSLLLEAVNQQPQITLNLRQLEFLNSSGISMLSMFVVNVRQQGNVQLYLQGAENILWQTKSLKNLQRLMPGLKLEFA